MKICPNCRNESNDDALLCPVCGTMLDALMPPSADYFNEKTLPAQMPELVPAEPAHTQYDHTKEYDAADIEESRLVCMCVYLLDILGVVVALLMCGSSEYTRFHIRQSLKITIVEALIAIASLVLCWTFVIPILGFIAIIVLLVIKLLCFADVCKGKATDAPILRSLKF